MCICVFFFFQAEDGIRDGRVTGVQTCALPISPSPQTRPTSDRLRETLFNILAPQIDGARFLDLCAGSGAVGIEALSRGAARSEERRVGKECRSGWAPDQQTKKQDQTPRALIAE